MTWPELATVSDRLWEFDAGTLAAARERAGRRRGRRLSRLLVEREEPRTKSEFERAFLRFLHHHRLRRPSEVNQRIDRNRDADLQILGYRVLRLV